MYFVVTLEQRILSTCSMLAVYVNTLWNQGPFWQKPWSLCAPESKAVHLGKRTGFVCNREACAKYTSLLIQGENELVPCSKVCITGLFLAVLQGVWGVKSTAEFSFQIYTSVLVTCKPQLHVVCGALFLQGQMLWFLSLNGGDWKDFSSVGPTLLSEYRQYNSWLDEV